MEKRNIFVECEETLKQIAKANGVTLKIGLDVAIDMANEVSLTGGVHSGVTTGVENFMTWVGNVQNFSREQLEAQKQEYIKSNNL